MCFELAWDEKRIAMKYFGCAIRQAYLTHFELIQLLGEAKREHYETSKSLGKANTGATGPSASRAWLDSHVTQLI